MFALPSLRQKAYAAAFGLCASSIGAFGAAHAQSYTTDYSISFAGIPVARSSFNTIVRGDTLTLTGSLASAGIGSAFASVKGKSEVTAKITDKGIITTSYALNYTYGKKPHSTLVTFEGGRAVKSVVTPQRKPGKGLVAVEEAHLKSVVDPFLASVISASGPREVCSRTIRVYDGTTRSDLALRYVGTEPVSARGFKGDGVRCAVRYVPVSGHRAGSSSIEFMSTGERASITFASFPGSGLYAPIKATIKTKSGTITIVATRFEVQGG
jgi:hypothetical protein